MGCGLRELGGERAAVGEVCRAWERELAAWTAAVVAPWEGGLVVGMARERVGGV